MFLPTILCFTYELVFLPTILCFYLPSCVFTYHLVFLPTILCFTYHLVFYLRTCLFTYHLVFLPTILCFYQPSWVFAFHFVLRKDIILSGKLESWNHWRYRAMESLDSNIPSGNNFPWKAEGICFCCPSSQRLLGRVSETWGIFSVEFCDSNVLSTYLAATLNSVYQTLKKATSRVVYCFCMQILRN